MKQGLIAINISVHKSLTNICFHIFFSICIRNYVYVCVCVQVCVCMCVCGWWWGGKWTALWCHDVINTFFPYFLLFCSPYILSLMSVIKLRNYTCSTG